MKKNRRELLKKIGLFGFLVVASLIGILYHKYLDSLPQDYTEGTIKGYWKPARGNTEAVFIYYFDGIKHKNSVDYYGYENIAKQGKKFIVKYPENYTDRGLMLLDHPVPDSVEAPHEGWDEMPEF